MQYKSLNQSDSEQIIKLLQEVEYPDAPSTPEEMACLFKMGRIEGIFEDDTLVGVLMLYHYAVSPELIGFDVAIRPEYKGKWGSKSLFKTLFGYAFGEMGGFAIIGKSSVPGAQNGLERLGFIPTGMSKNGEQVYTLLKTESRFA